MSKPMRADAQRSLDALLQAAKEIFAVAGVDAHARHRGQGGPRRGDRLPALPATVEPDRRRLSPRDRCLCGSRHRAGGGARAVRGAAAMDAALLGLLRHQARARRRAPLGRTGLCGAAGPFDARLRQVLEKLLALARTAGRIRSDTAAGEVLGASARSSMSDGDEPVQAQRVVVLLAHGLRCRDGH